MDDVFFFIQAEDGIRDGHVTGVQTCALPISLATEGSGSSIRTESAEGPRRPSATPKSTRVPGLGLGASAGSAEACRKTSLPSSAVMKPKHRALSNHLTIPVSIGPLTFQNRLTG